jgi:hypothetical protein
MPSKFDWKKYEAELIKCLEKSIRGVMTEFSDEHFYSAAFHSFYREYGDRIALPCLAVNTEEEIDDECETQWSSPDWYWDDLEYESELLSGQHERLNEFARSVDDGHWEQIHTQWMDALVRVAKQVTARLKKQKQATNDFGFFLFDEESDEADDLLRRCMTPAKFKRLFPQRLEAVERKQAEEKLPASEKLAVYAADLSEENCLKLLAQGKKAIPVLIKVLDGKHGWHAARLLGLLGIRDKQAIDALRQCVTSTAKSSRIGHASYSLALLGDIDFLLKLAKKAKTRKIAIDAIKRLYSDFLTGNSAVPVPLDYRPLERLLEIDACRKPAQSYQRTEYGFDHALERREIVASDVDEAIRGTTSKYKMIREHAVRCLGNRSLGKAQSEKAMQAIVDRFEDRAVSVRYLASLNIRYWRKSAINHVAAIRKVSREDPDPDVRDTARCTLQELGAK